VEVKSLEELVIKEFIRSRDEKRILTGKITGIENEYYKVRNESIPCAIIWYNNMKILIPITHLGLGTEKQNKSVIRGVLGAEIDFIVIEIDEISNIVIASRKDAMQLRAELELPGLQVNDTVRVRILAVSTKHIVVELYGKEVIIKAENLQHTYITNCKELYSPGGYLKVRIKAIDIQKGIYELSSKDFLENPYKNIRKFTTEGGEYTGKVIAFPKNNSGIIVQLDNTKVTCLARVPARFNNYPHYLDTVLVRISEIKEDKKLIYGYLMRIIGGNCYGR
jgi:small subunit ribosomal protein S1